MKYRILVRIALSVAALAVVTASVYIVAIFDPFEWGIIQSRHFTWEKFASVHEGERIERVIARLGDPIRRPYTFEVLTTNPTDPCIRGDCKEYFFAGARWGTSYKEAIVITDRNGRVIHSVARQE